MAQKVCIVYRSLTGNTKKIANQIALHLKKYEVEFVNMDDLDPAVLLDYDGILLGSYTWGRGSLPYEASVFHRKLSKINLIGKVVGCFGSGENTFPDFCAAVDTLNEKAKECGATVVNHGLKIHLAPDCHEDFESCRLFAMEFKYVLEQLKCVTISSR